MAPSRHKGPPILSITDEGLRKAISFLKAGALVVFPTDTLYALGAVAYDTEALERLFTAKGRAHDRPIPLLLGSVGQLLEVAANPPQVAWRLAEAFWPGALTLVVRKNPRVPALVSGGGETVAVRVPRHPVAEELLRGVGMPLTGTSANLSGQPAPVTAQEAWAQLGGRVALLLDGGACPQGVPSTVVDVTGPELKVLREGAIAREVVARVLGVEAWPRL